MDHVKVGLEEQYSQLGSILGKIWHYICFSKAIQRGCLGFVAMFHESLESTAKSKSVAGLKHTLSLYLWPHSIHNQRKMEARSFLKLKKINIYFIK